MKRIIFAVAFSFMVAFFLVNASHSYARGHGDDREGYEEDHMSGEDSKDDLAPVQPAAEDSDDPADAIEPKQEVNEGAGPIVDDDGGM
jgi:hypothetical protein